MLRAPPRSTLFPTRRSSDLIALAGSNPGDFAVAGSGVAPCPLAGGPVAASASCERHGEGTTGRRRRSEEHTSELQSLRHLVCRLLLEKKKKNKPQPTTTQQA